MKTWVRTILFPMLLVAVAIGVSFAVGRLEEEKSAEAENIARAPLAPLPGRSAQRVPQLNRRDPADYLSREDAVAQLTDILNGYRPEGVRDPVMNILRQMKPGEGLTLAFEWPELQANPLQLQQMVMNWARQDTHAALEWAGTLPADVAQRYYKSILAPPDYTLFPGQPTVDAKIAAHYLDKLTNPDDRNLAVGAITAGWARTDPAGALAWLGQQATGDLYSKTTTAIFHMLAAPELKVIARPDGSSLAMRNDGQSDPAAAVTLLTKVEDPALRRAAIGEIASGWAQSDPEAAAQWATNLPAADNAAREAALNTIVAGWAVNDPTAAVAFAEKSGNAASVLPQAPAVADALAKYDAEGALQFVQSLPEGTARDQALNNVLVTVAPTDLPAAWDFASKLPSGTSRDAALNSLVLTQAKMDPAKAMPLLASLDEGAVQNTATRALAKEWAVQDAQAASTWINTLPQGAQHDVAVYELIPTVAAKDPAAALNWSNTLTESSTRADYAQWILTTWAAKDSAAALAAVPLANLSDEQKAGLAAAIAQAQAKAK